LLILGIRNVNNRGTAGFDAISLTVLVERKSPDLPNYAVVPNGVLQPWGLQGTTTVEGEINGIQIGRRSIKRWDEGRWFIEFPASLAHRAGFETGDRVRLELRVASVELPRELEELLKKEPRARETWDRLSESRRRMLREQVLSAKGSGTKIRRAREALLDPAK
jgi:hypothetical protein